MQHSPRVSANARPMTMADILAVVESSRELAPARRRDMRSACTILCEWLRSQPEQIPATRRGIAERMARLSAERLDVSKARLANVRSLINAALDLAGAPTLRRNQPIAPQWAEIVKLADRQGDYNALSKFARFATGLSVLPHAIDDPVSSQYLRSLIDGSMVAKPREKHQDFCRV